MKAKKIPTVKCAFGKCKHDDKEIIKDEAVKIGSRYYHQDCARIKQNIETTVSLFVEHINSNVVMAELRKVINNIVFDRNMDSDFLLFALRYCINSKRPLNYPPGLYYVVQDKEILKAYNALIAKNMNAEIKKANEIIDGIENHFTYTPIKQRGFTDILGK